MAERLSAVDPGGSNLARHPASPWPRSAVFDPEGLSIGGARAPALAERFGTPLLVIDQNELRDRFRAVRSHFPRVLYAMKALTIHPVLRMAVEEGLDLLAASGGEVEAALRAGIAGRRIALHGNNKSDDELRLAVEAGLSFVIADGAPELERLAAIARSSGAAQAVLLRVMPGIEVETHEAIATGHERSKFGTPVAGVPAAAELARSLEGITFVGLHAHLGSQVMDAAPYLSEVDVLVRLIAQLAAETGLRVEQLDIGGGFGITYTDERVVEMPEVAAAVLGRLEERCRALGVDVPALAVEPGRALVGPAALTLYRVGARKELPDGTTVIAVDGGMSDNIRPALYGARYTVGFASAPRTGALRTVTVVGRHCESGDTLAADVALPADVGPGDLLAFAATGAYTYSLASSYNRVGRPAVVAVRGAGPAELWMRREDPADLDRLETAAHRWDPVVISPPGITIRAARPRDARSFRDFWAGVVDEGRYVRSERVEHPSRVYRRRFRRPWSDREAQIVAVDEAHRVVGHLYIQRETHPVTSHVATLGVAVAADARGKGVGSALLGEALRWASGAGVEKIVLSVYPYNTAAIALYRKFGFIDEGRLARQSRKSSGYEDEILMATWIGEDRS